MKSVLVTGATGFIGQYLIEALQQGDYRVVAAIRRAVDLPAEIRQVADLNDQTDWQTALQGIDVIVHLAARAHVLNEQETSPEAEFLKVNTNGTINLIQQAIAAGVQQFIFISSIGAVTSLSDLPVDETSECCPDTAYGRSKLATEKALIEITDQRLMAWTILRPTLVYGAGNPGNMERLFKLIETNLPLPLGRINNQRSFVYVENLVDAIATCIDHPHALNQTFHVSDGQTLSTPELVRLIATCADLPCVLLPVPVWLLRALGQVGDRIEPLLGRQLPLNSQTVEKLTGSLVVENHRICNILDWHPPFSIETGLQRTFQKV